MEQRRVDWISFSACVAIIVVVCIPLAASPDTAGVLLQSLYDTIAEELGFFYLLASVAAIAFLVWLASSRFGSVRLGDVDSKPEFGQLSWIAMLFCAGVGAGLMYWCATEWAYYYDAPPFGVTPRSTEATEWASTYGLFHWGFKAWAFYCLPTIAIAYPYYVRRLNVLRFSVCCHWFLPRPRVWPRRTHDRFPVHDRTNWWRRHKPWVLGTDDRRVPCVAIRYRIRLPA